MVVSILLSVFVTILLVLYARQLHQYGKAFRTVDRYHTSDSGLPIVSIIIPARNEEKNLGRCLDSLMQLDYPKDRIEVIVVDDDSEDSTATIAAAYPITLLRNKPKTGSIAFKKQAIATGITAAKGELVFTTDADCTVKPNWVKTMVAALQANKAFMVTGPVRMVPDKTFLSRFQSLDFAILQGITAASVQSGLHDMSSGANLAYNRQTFLDVNGFEGIDDIASGDDMLLMQKISGQYPGKVCYCFSEDAIVDTGTEPTWKAFLRQRIRWASKATRYRDKNIFRILLMVYLLNLTLLAMICISWIGAWPLFSALTAILIKTLVEWDFVSRILRFFSLQHLMQLFPVAQPVHIAYTVVSGLFGQIGSYRWKGRKVK